MHADDTTSSVELRSALALDGDVLTGIDQELAFNSTPEHNIEAMFALDGNLATKRDIDLAWDGNVVTKSRRSTVDEVVKELKQKSDEQKQKLASELLARKKLPSPWDQAPTPFLKKPNTYYD